MARTLAGARLKAVYSYAGRTTALAPQPLPVRVGGFGGAEGLSDYLRREAITHIIDATHPFAAQMSRNAVLASAETGVKLIALQRPAWQAGPGDRWHHVQDYAGAAAALPGDGSAVFLAIGRQNLTPFQDRDHRWLLRFAEDHPHPLTGADLILQRGPFRVENDIALLRAHRIRHIVAKNAGGEAARAKLIAAQRLSLPVIMIDRPTLPERKIVATSAEVMAWLQHADLGV